MLSKKKTDLNKGLVLLYIFAPQSVAQVPPNATTILKPIPTMTRQQAPADDPSFTDPDQFKSQILNDQNWFRAQHGAAPFSMEWWPCTIESKLSVEVFVSHSVSSVRISCRQIVWILTVTWETKERRERRSRICQRCELRWRLETRTAKLLWNNPGFSEWAGHFTQLVWKGSSRVGCARQKCRKPSSSSSLE